MTMRLRKTIVIGATMAIVGLGTPALAQTPTTGGVVPQVFAGSVDCTTPEIVAYCNLSNPIELAISPPKNNNTNIFTTAPVARPAFPSPSGFRFRIALTVAPDSTFSFQDQSVVEESAAPNQQADTPGVECVISRSSSLANVYRRINWQSDSGLMPPGGSIGQIRFCWSEGPCKEKQTTVTNTCSAWNQDDGTPQADILQGHVAPDQLVNLCGCSSAVRFCDPTVPAAQGGCFTAGAGIAALDTQATATTQGIPPPPAALGFSALATTAAATITCPKAPPADPNKKCVGTSLTTIGGVSTTTQVCVPESTADTDTICP